MSPASGIVELRDVAKKFGAGPPVLTDFSLAARSGEFLSFIGPSGCGKSTLLRLIAGLTDVSAGELRVDGRTPEQAASELAFVFQEPTLLPWLDVASNVEVPLHLRGAARPARTAARDGALRLVGLTGREAAYPRQLSGGQKMRVSLARALVLAPKILLLDEPFGALDEMTRERLQEELLTIRAQQGWTAFFVTHSVAEAVFLSDRIFVMSPQPGRLSAEIAVPLPQPRTAETRLSRRYQDLVVAVTRQLRSSPPP
ncbi:MAG: ABC transporter ATP-binding protein [Verrucomicrobiota bacterium]